MTDHELREKVHNLRKFYINLTLYVVVNFALILIWALNGDGDFWPIWVILAWGLSLAFHAIQTGAFPVLNEYFPYFTKDWEEEQIKKIKQGNAKPEIKVSVNAPIKAPAKVVEKKTPVAKPVVKKAAAVKKKAAAPKKKAPAAKS